MRAAPALLIAGLSLAGCTTTPMVVSCDPFRTHFSGAVPRSATLGQIQSDDYAPGQALTVIADTEAARAERYEALIGFTLANGFIAAQSQQDAVLALSGGGQWGAFGAGYLQELNNLGVLPRFGMITGVSTGALQALFVGANQAPNAKSEDFLKQLVDEYTIKDENDVVNRGGYVGALFSGSVAKLDPLRRKIETALCRNVPINPQAAGDCPLIQALATPGAPVVLLGFVDARSGEMQAINVSAIAHAAVATDAKHKVSIKDAQQCITGGALASVAMPFFYQQVQVTSNSSSQAIADAAGEGAAAEASERTLTYFDGGVRQSMFLFESVKAFAKAQAKLRPESANESGPSPLAPARPVYMIRNGPTVAKVDPKADGARGAIPTAERGYSVMVNQSEVTAIEAIRLRDDKSEMRLATADGYQRAFPGWESTKKGEPGGCQKKNESAMFEPEFMECLRALGRTKARGYPSRPNGWINLTPVQAKSLSPEELP